MPLYRVRWEIDIGAATPTEAAARALIVQRDTDPANAATVFEVRLFDADDSEPFHIIDLNRDDPDDRNHDPDPGEMDGDHESGLASVYGPNE